MTNMRENRDARRPTDDRLSGTTRGKILGLLCRERRTVAELAVELGITDNAVRAQLERFQRDGLVSKTGSKPGVRRPHAEYELTPQARELFPRAYEPVLRVLADVLSDRVPPRTLAALLRETLERFLHEHIRTGRRGTPRQRLDQILTTLNGASLGIELTDAPGATVVRSCSCPLASLTVRHPEWCQFAARAVGDLLGTTVIEKCERGGTPRCCFMVAEAGPVD
jgi:predicted ArsR family transcriptional regulator